MALLRPRAAVSLMALEFAGYFVLGERCESEYAGQVQTFKVYWSTDAEPGRNDKMHNRYCFHEVM